jgi:hypothetical protein
MKAQKIMLVLIAACFALLVAVLVYGFVAFGGSADTSADVTTESTPTAAPDTTPSVPDDTTAPDSTTAPPETTPKPETTPAPETSAPTDYPSVSGSFASALEVQLGVDVDWRTISRTATEAEIEFTVVLNSYKLGLGARSNNYLKIGEDSYKFSTPKINITESGKHETVLAVLTAKVPLTNGAGTFDASCSWNYNGTYSGVKFNNIVFGGVIEIK